MCGAKNLRIVLSGNARCVRARCTTSWFLKSIDVHQALDLQLNHRLTIERGFFELYQMEPLEVIVPPSEAASQEVMCVCVGGTLVAPFLCVTRCAVQFRLTGALRLVFREIDAA